MHPAQAEKICAKLGKDLVSAQEWGRHPGIAEFQDDNDSEIGVGRDILIRRSPQGGQSFEICLVGWLSRFLYESVPASFATELRGAVGL